MSDDVIGLRLEAIARIDEPIYTSRNKTTKSSSKIFWSEAPSDSEAKPVLPIYSRWLPISQPLQRPHSLGDMENSWPFKLMSN